PVAQKIAGAPCRRPPAEAGAMPGARGRGSRAGQRPAARRIPAGSTPPRAPRTGRGTAPWFGLPDAATRRGALAAMALHVRGHDVHRWVAGQLADIAARGAGR
ncbi:MAG TPA: hypothetical protein VEH31_23080, partial [Streptosporangiaceae bacterium]|nr:hypothetical protein [Streptosporangiaceae bacterium]